MLDFVSSAVSYYPNLKWSLQGRVLSKGLDKSSCHDMAQSRPHLWREWPMRQPEWLWSTKLNYQSFQEPYKTPMYMHFKAIVSFCVFFFLVSPLNVTTFSKAKEKILDLSIIFCGPVQIHCPDENHSQWVSCVCFSSKINNPIIASCGWDKLGKVWNLPKLQAEDKPHQPPGLTKHCDHLSRWILLCFRKQGWPGHAVGSQQRQAPLYARHWGHHHHPVLQPQPLLALCCHGPQH